MNYIFRSGSYVRMFAASCSSSTTKCISSSGSCGNCVQWRAEAGEIQDDGGARRLEVATWSPVLGLDVKDDLFPHVAGGLRGRRVKITSIEVI